MVASLFRVTPRAFLRICTQRRFYSTPAPVLRSGPNESFVKGFFPDTTDGVTTLKSTAVIQTKPLESGNSETFEIPSIWLRDHCQCAQCIHPETKQREVDVFSVSTNMQDCVLDESMASVTWADGHKSQYELAWLRQAFDSKRLVRDRAANHNVTYWTAGLLQSPHVEIDYTRVMETQEGVAEWTDKIRQYGFCFVNDCPTTPEATEALIQRIGPIRNTHYGAFWDFTANMASKDTAYTSQALDVHTDTNYFSDPAGLQLFHLLSHDGEGGENQLVDGFKAGRILKERNVDHYNILKRQQLFFHSSGNEGLSIQPSRPVPTLSEDFYGALRQVRWNNADRAAFYIPNSHRDDVPSWYKAARAFNDILHSDNPSIRCEFKLKPGRPLIFDNWRVLHGRSSFTGARRMCGGYVNRDDFISRYRTSNFGHDEILRRGIY